MKKSNNNGFLEIFVLKCYMREPFTGMEIMNIAKEVLPQTPSTGSVYPLISNLHKKGYLERMPGFSKKYEITEDGKVYFAVITKEYFEKFLLFKKIFQMK